MDATEHFEDAAAWLSSTPAAANLSNDSKLEVGEHPIQILAILADDMILTRRSTACTRSRLLGQNRTLAFDSALPLYERSIMHQPLIVTVTVLHHHFSRYRPQRRNGMPGRLRARRTAKMPKVLRRNISRSRKRSGIRLARRTRVEWEGS